MANRHLIFASVSLMVACQDNNSPNEPGTLVEGPTEHGPAASAASVDQADSAVEPSTSAQVTSASSQVPAPQTSSSANPTSSSENAPPADSLPEDTPLDASLPESNAPQGSAIDATAQELSPDAGSPTMASVATSDAATGANDVGTAACSGEDDDTDGVPNACDTCPGFDDNNLRVIEGDLTVFTQAELDALAGVGSIMGTLRINKPLAEDGDPITLTSFEPLSCLRVVRSNLLIYSVGGIKDLSGLRSLQDTNQLTLSELRDLETLEGLGPLTELGVLDIFGLGKLRNLDGLKLTKIGGGWIRIWGNSLLENVDALSSLTSVEGFVMIDSNTVLENLDGFGAVTSIGENLSITRNPALSQLRGLHNVGSLSSGLSITNNAALPACEAELLRDSIGVANIAGMIEIEENTGTGDCATP